MRAVGRPKLGLRVAQELAISLGGACLSKTYVSLGAHLTWRCVEGHQWTTSLKSVRHSKSWCLDCARKAPLKLAIAGRIAAARGGSCLSDVYTNAKTHLLWRCQYGHEWHSNLDKVKNSGTWCPHCSNKSRLDLEVALEVAKARSGLCLSDQYINCMQPLRWRCQRGHEWDAPLRYIRNGDVVSTLCEQLAARPCSRKQGSGGAWWSLLVDCVHQLQSAYAMDV